MAKLAFSVDTDWAPTPLIEDTADLFREFDVEATFFSTHDDGLSLSEHERAIHPNFYGERPERDTVERFRAALAEISEVFPDATGARSHSLVNGHPVRRLYDEFGIEYESNYLMYGQDGLEPLHVGEWSVELPIFFGDDIWLKTGFDEHADRQYSGEPRRVDPEAMLGGTGLKVFCFHPHHVFLNEPDWEYYMERGHLFPESDEVPGVDQAVTDPLREARYDGYGVRTLLTDLLEYAEANDVETAPLADVVDSFRETDASPIQ